MQVVYVHRRRGHRKEGGEKRDLFLAIAWTKITIRVGQPLPRSIGAETNNTPFRKGISNQSDEWTNAVFPNNHVGNASAISVCEGSCGGHQRRGGQPTMASRTNPATLQNIKAASGEWRRLTSLISLVGSVRKSSAIGCGPDAKRMRPVE
ncbi:hypothetical protein BX600DRAFT_466502 [Xylariales sp. PMI_506]|nr:hypothetical protein BX600DRAFT_466502 [Xylariales sp. PMI_506]